MRVGPVTIIALSLAAAAEPAFALQANETMKAWEQASVSERAALLERLVGKRGGDIASIKICLDAASEVDGHAELEIAQVAKACAAAKDNGDPV